MNQEKYIYYLAPEHEDLFCKDVSDFLHDLVIQCKAESREHLWYVREYTRILTNTYSKLFTKSRMTLKKQEMIVKASVLHDIGKITISDYILDKPGHLSMTEMEALKKHTIKGSQIIKSMSWDINRDFMRICYNVCLYHHEKYDGSGYPYGLKADKIPVEAQLVGLADMYDVLIHSDVNRKKMEKSKAYYMLMTDKCGEISPRLKECFECSREKLENIVFTGSK